MEKVKKLLKKVIKGLVVGVYNLVWKYIPADERLIVFDSSTGCNYTGSPRAVYEKMVELGLDDKYSLIWFFKKGNFPEGGIKGKVRLVRYGSFRYLLAMLRAKVWVFDARQAEFLKKRANQHYIQIWHGTPLKRLALDLDSVNMADNTDIDEYKRSFKENTATWDFLVAQNQFSVDIFRRCFAFEKEFLKTGYPRNDILFKKNNDADILELKQRLRLPLDRKIILYAPTWRDDEYDKDGIYEFKPKLDFELLKEKLGREYAVIVKYHYLVGDKIDWSELKGFVYPFNAGADISELYLVADEMITDYSSVMFDYALLKRPMYFYAYDLDKYEKELRGFYFDFLSEAPGPISRTTEELIRDIRLSDEEKDALFENKRKAFYDKFGTFEDGRASEKIINLIDRIMK